MQENNISKVTVMSSELMTRMLAEMTGEEAGELDRPVASKFLRSLFKELGVPVTKGELNNILTACMNDEKGKFSVEEFRALVSRTLPRCMFFHIQLFS